jgi:cyanophycinase
VLDHPELVGIGIDEKTAILVHGSRFEVLGDSNVVVVDPRGSHERSSDRMQPGAIRDVGLHVLRKGMTFDLAPDQR